MAGPLTPLRRALRPALHETLRRRALAKGPRLAPVAQGGVTVARVIGNDLVPRHAPGQALRNLDLILRQETCPEGWQKLFILNRWFDDGAAARAAADIAARGHLAVTLPFDAAAYARAATDWRFLDPGPVPDPDRALRRLAALDGPGADRARLWALRAKLEAAVGLNTARNLALDIALGRGGAAGAAGSDWAVLLDGGCFVPAASFAALHRDMVASPFAPAVVVPMRRGAAADPNQPAPADWREEPQIALHRSARLRFDARFPYGLRDKTTLFTALGVAGPWDDWGRDGFLPPPHPTPDRHRYRRASAAVLRLPSGPALEGPLAQRPRHQARTEAILATIAHLDRLTGAADADLTRRLIER